MTRPPDITALLCRTSDRTPRGAHGARALAETLAERTGTSAQLYGSPTYLDGRWDDDLAAAQGCLQHAKTHVEQALAGERLPVLCAGDCSICVATLPTVAALVPGVRVLWLDAHGDFHTPGTTPSSFLGGMCLAGACGRWDTGLPGALDPERVVMVGARDLDAPEAPALDAAGVLRLDPAADVAAVVAGGEVFVHLDLDVLDPGVFPAQFGAPGGMSAAALRDLLAGVARAAGRVVGVEVTAFEAPEDAGERSRLAGIAADAVTLLLA